MGLLVLVIVPTASNPPPLLRVGGVCRKAGKGRIVLQVNHLFWSIKSWKNA